MIIESAAPTGMAWAATEVKAKIVNMSFGGPELDPVEHAINTLSQRYEILLVAGG
ncbi:hypothetical protein ACIA8R_44785 [Nonomuraea sp. NPDC051191]|uniref:hypothetical protein n=1 Tax=Nonomuraea sp. NPDC051191 TaxID=3364372 RepID=UPI0037ACDA2B